MLVSLNSTGAHGATIPADAPADLERYTYQFYVAPLNEALAALIKSLPPRRGDVAQQGAGHAGVGVEAQLAGRRSEDVQMIVTSASGTAGLSGLIAVPSVVPNHSAVTMPWRRTAGRSRRWTRRPAARSARSRGPARPTSKTAVEMAKAAQPAWAAMTVVKRGEILRQIALLMRAAA